MRPYYPAMKYACLSGVLALALPAWASQDLHIPAAPAGHVANVAHHAWQAVDASTLEQARGGFTAPSGLNVALGIERMVSVNGEILAQSHIAIADLAHISHEEAQQTSAALSSLKLVQHGNDNIYLAPMAQQAMAGMVIQNSLDGQQIRTDTMISSTVNSMSLLKSINAQASLGDALLHAAGYR
jgi:hypothetical protein